MNLSCLALGDERRGECGSYGPAEERAPVHHVDPEVTYASMSRLIRIIEQENALVIFHHDPAEWPKVKMAPDYYD